MNWTHIDLFAGIGGFRLAVARNGGRTIGYSEINADAISAYEANYADSRETNFGDITKLNDLPPHDFMTGGVPCQSWSIAGRNLGFDDDRGQLWNDAVHLLKKSRPRAFLFENVKGLVDPRNKDALDYIMRRIAEAGYHASVHVLNSFDYGVPQSRVRIYIIGFQEKRHHDLFKLPQMSRGTVRLRDILDDGGSSVREEAEPERDLFGEVVRRTSGRTSLSTNNNGFNDYFLFNDLRNGDTTIHSWDIVDTTPKERRICLLLLRNRRRRDYGRLDGNPLSLAHLQELDKSISQSDVDALCGKGIIRPETYSYKVVRPDFADLTEPERLVMKYVEDGRLVPDNFCAERKFKIAKVRLNDALSALVGKGVVEPDETRYDFRYTKISTGLFGVNRIFLPSSNIFPTLVASDSNDYVTDLSITATDREPYRRRFIEEVYKAGRYRRITKSEACRVQGFPPDFNLPDSRSRWMKLIGNSVSVPVIEQLVRSIVATGVFE